MEEDGLSLKFPEENAKQAYTSILRDDVRVPVCKNCSCFFAYGFPTSDDGLLDYLICSENDLICDCIHHSVIARLLKQKGDSLVDITAWYHVLGRR